MDKFEMEQYTQIRDLIADLQTCFITFDGEGYARTPSAEEWRRAARIVHRLNLTSLELYGYSNACRQYNVVSIRERLQVVPGENEIEETSNRGVVIFTEKEILQMPKNQRKYFRIDGRKVPYRKRANGVYELRKQIDGVSYYGAATDLNEAKKRFIEDLRKAECIARQKEKAKASVTQNLNMASEPTVPDWESYVYNYIDVFKRPNICEKAYNNYLGLARRHLIPPLKNKNVDEVTAEDCQKILTNLRNAGKKRTAEDANHLLAWICAAAVTDGILKNDPMGTVKIPKHYRKKGQCIPRAIMREILSEPKNLYDYVIMFRAYTGVRPCEVVSTKIDRATGLFTIKNAKEDPNAEPTFRKIAIHPRLVPHLDKIEECLSSNMQYVTKYWRLHKTNAYRFYDLRHTFTTIAQECGANKEWVDYVTNHVSEQNVTERIYTDWSNEFHKKQIILLEY